MAQTRAQIASQRKRLASTLKAQEQQYRAKSPPKSTRPSRRRHTRPPDLTHKGTNPDPVRRRAKRGRAEDPPERIPDDHPRKRRRASPEPAAADDTSGLEAVGGDAGDSNPIGFWIRGRYWPPAYFEQDAMENLLARKKSPSLRRKRSESGTAPSSTTPSDQKSRDEKSAPYRDPRYKALLQTKGSHMDESRLGITEESKKTCHALLNSEQTAPRNSLFRDDLFKQTCQRVEDRNEARVIRDITPLIVPSTEILATYGAAKLECLIESLNEGWNNSMPLTGTRPQPDYSVGFKRETFTEDQLKKLSPFIGDWISGDQSFFMATYYMYFPFLSCEVKCGAVALDIADRQNAHSMTLAARAVVELFRLVGRQSETHQQILAFSVSHDHESLRIYGYYPVIDGKDTKYYRHPIRKFDFTELDGKEKWTAYRFTKNVYDLWMPGHLDKIRSAIDELPSNLDFDVPPLPETGLSQGLESSHLSQPDTEPVSASKKNQTTRADVQVATPESSFTEPGARKKAPRLA